MARRDATAYCRNCGALLTGPYCSVCGQRAADSRRPVVGLVQDVLVDTLAIDGRLARTLWLLLRAPGRLAANYISGKRVRYTPPFRLYLFASVLFFFLGGLLLSGVEPAVVDFDEVVEPSTRAADASPPATPSSPDEEASLAEAEAGAERLRRLLEMSWADFDVCAPAWLDPHLEQMFTATQRLVQDPRLFLAQSRTNLPRFLLLAPVLYALILILLYSYRRRFLAYDHFVVSLYIHAALYAYLMLALFVARLPVVGELWVVPLVWGGLQPFAALRQAYGSGRVSMVLKGAVLLSLYWAGALVFVALGLGYSLYRS